MGLMNAQSARNILCLRLLVIVEIQMDMMTKKMSITKGKKVYIRNGSHSARSSPAFPAIPRRSKEGQGGCEKSLRGQGDARRAMEAPFIYRSTSVSSNNELALLKAAMDGDLNCVKGIIKNLGKGKGNRGGFSLKNGGSGVLHTAACMGHLEICMYLIGELGADPNMIYGEGPTEGTTAFMASAQSSDISTVKYFLEHGGDLMKPDSKGRTVLHHAVCAGSCKVTEFLLSKGIPVDIEYGHGTPLYHASINEQDKTEDFAGPPRKWKYSYPAFSLTPFSVALALR